MAATTKYKSLCKKKDEIEEQIKELLDLLESVLAFKTLKAWIEMFKRFPLIHNFFLISLNLECNSNFLESMADLLFFCCCRCLNSCFPYVNFFCEHEFEAQCDRKLVS